MFWFSVGEIGGDCGLDRLFLLLEPTGSSAVHIYLAVGALGKITGYADRGRVRLRGGGHRLLRPRVAIVVAGALLVLLQLCPHKRVKQNQY